MKTSDLKPALLVAVLALTACSGPSTPTESAAKTEAEKAAEAPPVPVTAKTAFFEMYKPAYKWAADMVPLTIEAKPVEGFKIADGKAAMWQATFGSPSLKQFATFTYSVVTKPPDIRKGVSAAGAVPWAGPTHDALPFQSSELTVDSDAAYKTALEKAGPWLQKNPGVDVTTLSVGAASRVPGPVWSVVWGDKKSGFFQLVSATTGKALK